MNLLALPALTDNYIWMVHDEHRAIVVDPGDEEPVVKALDAMNLELVGILVTHHHHDHVDGIGGLRRRLLGQVYGSATEVIAGPYQPVSDGQQIVISPWDFQVMLIPGHTAGHVAYFLELPDAAPIVFCGDTLFSGGCGRLFEGSPARMLASLKRLAALPANTRVCCTHEYTLSNMKFARHVEPMNQQALIYEQWCQVQRQAGRPTLPSSIELEQKINPFLRCDQTQVRQSVKSYAGSISAESPEGELAVFTILRQWKNGFVA